MLNKEALFEVDKMIMSWRVHFKKIKDELEIEKGFTVRQREKMNTLRY